MAVGDGDRSRVRVDVDRREFGWLIGTRKGAGDQEGRIRFILAKGLGATD